MRCALGLIALVGLGCRDSAAPGPAPATAPPGAASAPAPTAAGPGLQISRPSAETVARLAALDGVSVVAFLRHDDGGAGDQLAGYLAELRQRSGGRLAVTEFDRSAAPAEAMRYEVTDDNTVVVVRGERTRHLVVSRQGPSLASFDAELRGALDALASERRVAVVGGTTSHTLVEKLLGMLDCTLVSVAPHAKALPDDLDLVVYLAVDRPTAPLLAAIDRHLARGGAALVAVEPGPGVDLGPLERRGVAFDATPIDDDQRFLVQAGEPADHALVMTRSFASHPTTATLQRGQHDVLFAGPGSLVIAESAASPRPLALVSSMASSFDDDDGDHRFDDGRERRGARALAVALEGPADDPAALRAVVVADTGVFEDSLVERIPTNQAFLSDALRWLLRVEEFRRTEAGPADLTSYPARVAPPSR